MYHCAHCDKHGAVVRRYINPPDRSSEYYKWFCNTACEAAWSTGQHRPPRPGLESAFEQLMQAIEVNVKVRRRA